MQLSEPAIHKLVLRAIEEETGFEPPTLRDYSVARAAARAIVERMAEGVEAEFEGRWGVDDLGYHVLTVSSRNRHGDKRIRIAQISQGGPADERDGQLVTVTISKVEPCKV